MISRGDPLRGLAKIPTQAGVIGQLEAVNRLRRSVAQPRLAVGFRRVQQRNHSRAVLKRLAKALGVPVTQLLE
jgi:hypothetical protein